MFDRPPLRVFDVRRSAAPAPSPTADASPTAEGVETLRAAWEFGWRRPTQPRRLRARIEPQTPATDDLWLGRKQVRGEFELAGYTGFRPWESSWSSYRFELEGTLSDVERLALAMVLDDRLRLWAGRDFNGRASFERAFADAKIGAPDAKGRIAIEGSRLASVLVREGRVVELERRVGGPLELTWKKLGEDWLVVRTEQGSERLDVNFARAGSEWVPATLRFERVFGDDWGPEEFKLGNLRVE